MSDLPTEIERRFLVKNDDWKKGIVKGGFSTDTMEDVTAVITQAYLSIDPKRTVRIRLHDDEASLTIKGETVGATRAEFNYDIPESDAHFLFTLCKTPVIRKCRYMVKASPDHLWWDVDVFEGDNEGLVIAEVEIRYEEEEFEKPDWLGEEVTHDHRYSNLSLAQHPYTEMKTCPTCEGTGWKFNSTVDRCIQCEHCDTMHIHPECVLTFKRISLTDKSCDQAVGMPYSCPDCIKETKG